MRCYLGIDLGGTNLAAGLTDGNLHITARKSIKTRVGADPEPIIEDLCGLILSMAADKGLAPAELDGIGIGVPGSVNREGMVEDANNIGFYQVPLKQILEERTGTAVHILNDAKAAAYGEYRAGAGKGSHADSFFMMTLGTGVGGAYIHNGVIVDGCNMASGEVGHMVLDFSGPPCTCGRRGCFEVFASASALAGYAREAARREPKSLLNVLSEGDPDRMNGKVLFEALEDGDGAAIDAYDKYLKYLAAGVANVINLLQPDILCIGGGISGQGERLTGPLRRLVAEQVYSRNSLIQTEIIAAKLGNDAGIIGAALAAGADRSVSADCAISKERMNL